MENEIEKIKRKLINENIIIREDHYQKIKNNLKKATDFYSYDEINLKEFRENFAKI